ncbi:MAG TPA: protein kinase [Gemmatimonadales bacterium]|nr:protein kinase [Gemmatimonadales bacterium]
MLDVLAQISAALRDRYLIERELGTGGMATVYLARELKHDREVALKVLRPELAAQLGADRFLNEIKVTARLDHPHILTLIDSGESDGFLWYAQPYIRGESLRDRLRREKQLGIDEALAISRQIAGALEYAHHHGVIHRDIKPENILLHEGEAMLSDFGIALALKQASGNRLTETGQSVGTPQYMSPEQATGERQLDARSDVYSLGTVLYEMLAGHPPHAAPTAQAIVAKLLTERPPRLRMLRDTVPPSVDAAVARALERTPADRFHSAAEFSASLQRPAPAPAAPSRRRELALGTALAIFAAGVALGAYRLLRNPAPGLAIGRSEQLTADPGLEIQPALSPDGRLVAYAAGTATRMRIYIRPVGGGAGGRTLPLSDDTTAVETHPRWSPDGTRLLFLTRGGASIVPALGGSSRPVVPPGAAGVISAAWSPDAREIAFVRSDSLLVVPVEGGATRFVATGSNLHSCTWAPHGKWIACVSLNDESVRPGTTFGNIAPSAILLFPAGGGAPVRVAEPRAFNQSPVFAANGLRLLFLSNRDGPRDMYGVTLSASGRPRGEPARLSTGLGAISISLSADDRRLAYAVYAARANIWSIPIPASGPVTTAGAIPITIGNQVIEAMSVSRDGRWLVYDSDLRGNADIYRVSIAGGQPEQLTSDPADEFAPDLAPNGRAVAYHSWRGGTRDIEVKPLDGGPIERVTDTPAQESYPVWSPDGGALAFYDQTRPFHLFVTRRGPDGRWSPPVPLADSAYDAEWSPDGRFLSYVKSATDADAGPLAVVPAVGGTPRLLYTPGKGLPPADRARWSPDGATLYFKAHDARGRASFWSVRATGGQPRLLVRFDDPTLQSGRKDFATEGKRFYFAVEDRQSDVFVAGLVRR